MRFSKTGLDRERGAGLGESGSRAVGEQVCAGGKAGIRPGAELRCGVLFFIGDGCSRHGECVPGGGVKSELLSCGFALGGLLHAAWCVYVCVQRVLHLHGLNQS